MHIKGDTFPWDTVWNYQENVDDLIAVAANTFDLAISVSIRLCFVPVIVKWPTTKSNRRILTVKIFLIRSAS